MQLRAVSNAGAYGNHSVGVLYHGCGECQGVYRCPNKQIDGYAVHTNTLPAGGSRGYGLSPTVFAVESAMDELVRKLKIDPFELRRRNVIGADAEFHDDVEMGSYGLTQCLDLVESALRRSPRMSHRRTKPGRWAKAWRSTAVISPRLESPRPRKAATS